MAEERVDIIITEKGSRVVKRQLEGIGATSKKSAQGVDFLKKALVSLGAVVSVNELRRFLDINTQLQNRLRATGLEAENLTVVYKELLGISNDTRSSFESSVELYARLAISTKELGISQQQLLDFTKSLNQAVLLSGASATEASAGILQLSQGIASGALRGDELRSVLEQLPAVADVIAKQLKVTRGELREMGTQGKITADVILKAFQSARGELEDRFAKTVPTISQSFQVLQNNLINVIGEFDKATGTSAALAKSLLFVADNLEVISKVLVSLGAGFAVILGGAKAINVLTGSVRALTAAIAANPLGFLLITLTSAITALTLFRDEISLGIDDVTTLGDAMSAFGEVVSASFGTLSDVAQATFGPLIDLLDDFFGEFEFSTIGILRVTAKGVDSFVGFWKGAISAVIVLFKALPAVLADLMTRALNLILTRIESFVNTTGELLSTVTEFAGLGTIAPVELNLTNENEGAAKTLGADVALAFANGFESVGFAEKFVNDIAQRAQAIGKVREAAEAAAAANVPDLSAGGGGAAKGLNAATIKSLDQLISSYDKVFAAQKDFTKGVQLLDQAQAAGAISAERHAQILALMEANLTDALNPLAAVNRELALEMELLGQTAQQREVSNQLRSIQQDLVSQGVILGEEELSQLRERLQLLQEETQLAQARDQILQDTLGTQQEFTTQLEAINQLKAEGKITDEQANQFLIEQNQELLAGTIEAQEAMVSQTEQTFARIDELRQADLISEQTAAQLKAKTQAELNAKQLQNAQKFFGTLTALSSSENKELAAIGKAAAVTQATIDGFLAVQKALASAPPPINFALAAAVGVATAANIASIVSQSVGGFAFGGDFKVGGTGGTDSQLVAFRATPGEDVSVRTPTQGRDAGRQGGGGGAPIINQRTVNIVDPALAKDFFETSEGEDLFVNMLSSNSDTLRSIVSEG